jgi:hypothetical protein
MQTFVLREASDIQGLATRLVDQRTANVPATIDRLKKFNPHVDFSKLKAGTVLILPDDPALKTSDKDVQSFGAWALHEFAAVGEEAFAAATERLRTNAESAGSDRNALAAALRSNIIKRQAEADPALAGQLESVASATAGDQKGLAQAASEVATLQKSFVEELAAMTKLLS